MVWLCHGPSCFSYYARNKDGYVIGLHSALRYVTDFLGKHPTETVILDITNESNAGDPSTIYANGKNTLDKYSSWIYKEGDSYLPTRMPQLKDVRGKIVIISDHNGDFGYGACSSMQEDWDGQDVFGIYFRYENHYKATASDKKDYVKAFYQGGTVDDAIWHASVEELPRTAKRVDRAACGRMACTSSNRAPFTVGLPLQTPEEIAKEVNKIAYTDADAIFKTRGKLYGWVYSDFVTAETIRTLYMSNFPVGKNPLKYAKITFVANVDGTEVSETANALVGTIITMPRNPFVNAKSQSRPKVVEWTVDGRTKQVGDILYVDEDTTAIATVTTSWSALWHKILTAPNGSTIELKDDVIAEPHDINSALIISSGKSITIEMNGHTIDRNYAQTGATGCVISIEEGGSLTLRGRGEIRGGNGSYRSGRAGGISLSNKATLVLDGPDIKANKSTDKGGGVFVGRGSTFTFASGGIHENTANMGGGVYVEKGGSFDSPADHPASVISENTASVGGGVFLDAGSSLSVSNGLTVMDNKTDKAKTNNVYYRYGAVISANEKLDVGKQIIGITTQAKPTAGKQVVFTRALADEDSAKHFFSDEGYNVMADKRNAAMLCTQVVVNFDSRGGSAVETRTIDLGTKPMRPADPTKRGYTFEGWLVWDGDAREMRTYEFENEAAPPKSNIQLNANWKPITWTVSFDTGGGTPIEPQYVESGSYPWRPSNPTKEGYVFLSWNVRVKVSDGTNAQYRYASYWFNEPVMSDLTVVAEWGPEDVKPTGDGSEHTVRFLDGGNVLEFLKVTDGRTAPRHASLEERIEQSKRFDGWYAKVHNTPNGEGILTKQDEEEEFSIDDLIRILEENPELEEFI